MRLGLNEQSEIVAVEEIPEGLTVIEVDNETFIGKDPTQYKIRVGENWQMITPRYPTQGL